MGGLNMLMVEVTSVVGRLTLRRVVEESYQHLQPLSREGHRVRDVLLDPHGDFQAQVTNYCKSPLFTITLSLPEIVGLDDTDFLMYLTRRYVECMSDDVRKYCSDGLDSWRADGQPTKAELIARPPTPVVEKTDGKTSN